MKRYFFILASIITFATAFTGCSKDDNETVPTPTPTPVEPSDVIDLGLPSGTLWAAANLGATEASAVGNLYAWGETYVKDTYSASNYFDAKSNIVTSNIIGTQYDAAAALGDGWQMPSKAQFQELFEQCKVKLDKDAKTITLTGPNEKQMVLPYTSTSATLYDNWINKKEETSYAKFENVYAAYWTGEISAISDPLNANQYAVQALYVEHAKNAVKEGGAEQYANVFYDRSRMVGAPIRPVKATGGTPVANYVNIKGTWAQSDASGNALPLSDAPSYMTFTGTNFTGKGINVVYGQSINEYNYSRDINKVSITIGDETKVATVAEVIAANPDDASVKRVISFTEEGGQPMYFVEATETFAVPASKLIGKWNFQQGTETITLNIINEENCTVKKGDNKVGSTYKYRFGTFSVANENFSGTFGVEATNVEATPFKFVSDASTITFVVAPKEYQTIFSWNGSTDTEAPSIFTLNGNNKFINDPGDGSKIKTDMMNMEGTSNYPYAIQLNKSVASTTVGEKSTQAADIATLAALVTYNFKTGDRIRIRGFFNKDNTTGSFKIFDTNGIFLGTGDPSLANYKNVKNVSESIFTFAADTKNIYISRQAGTGTFVCEFYIDREVED